MVHFLWSYGCVTSKERCVCCLKRRLGGFSLGALTPSLSARLFFYLFFLHSLHVTLRHAGGTAGGGFVVCSTWHAGHMAQVCGLVSFKGLSAGCDTICWCKCFFFFFFIMQDGKWKSIRIKSKRHVFLMLLWIFSAEFFFIMQVVCARESDEACGLKAKLPVWKRQKRQQGKAIWNATIQMRWRADRAARPVVACSFSSVQQRMFLVQLLPRKWRTFSLRELTR